jgi:hypothetical protein
MFLFFFLKRILNLKFFVYVAMKKIGFYYWNLNFEKSYSNHAYVYALELSVY